MPGIPVVGRRRNSGQGEYQEYLLVVEGEDRGQGEYQEYLAVVEGGMAVRGSTRNTWRWWKGEWRSGGVPGIPGGGGRGNCGQGEYQEYLAVVEGGRGSGKGEYQEYLLVVEGRRMGVRGSTKNTWWWKEGIAVRRSIRNTICRWKGEWRSGGVPGIPVGGGRGNGGQGEYQEYLLVVEGGIAVRGSARNTWRWWKGGGWVSGGVPGIPVGGGRRG